MTAFEDFRTVVEIQTRFRDTDAMGHVNNAVYLSFLEAARFEYGKTVLDWTSLSTIGIILARVEIDYRSPAYCGETLVVGVRVVDVGGASFRMAYKIREKETKRVVAEAQTVQVSYDYKAEKVVRLSENQVRKIKEHDAIT